MEKWCKVLVHFRYPDGLSMDQEFTRGAATGIMRSTTGNTALYIISNGKIVSLQNRMILLIICFS